MYIMNVRIKLGWSEIFRDKGVSSMHDKCCDLSLSCLMKLIKSDKYNRES